jgi:hypothetical protein
MRAVVRRWRQAGTKVVGARIAVITGNVRASATDARVAGNWLATIAGGARSVRSVVALGNISDCYTSIVGASVAITAVIRNSSA